MRNRLTERDLSRIVKRVINEQNEDDGKSDLIKSLQNSLSQMSNNNEYNATMVAQIIYNNCAQWMNKESYFSNRPGDPLTSQAPFAPEK
jgi:hypothetical protein